MDGCHVPTKHNFSNYKFDIALFTGTETKPVIQRNGRPKKIRGKVVTEALMKQKGNTNPKFVRRHNLKVDFLPHEYADAFVPLRHTTKDDVCLFATMSKFTNAKACLRLYKLFTRRITETHWTLCFTRSCTISTGGGEVKATGH